MPWKNLTQVVYLTLPGQVTEHKWLEHVVMDKSSSLMLLKGNSHVARVLVYSPFVYKEDMYSGLLCQT